MSAWVETYEQAREIGKRVRRQRNKYSFAGHLQRWLSAGVGTIKQLAAASGYGESVIYNIKNEQHNPSRKMTNDLMQAMGIVEQSYVAKWQKRSSAK